jgi:hypothetical protein
MEDEIKNLLVIINSWDPWEAVELHEKHYNKIHRESSFPGGIDSNQRNVSQDGWCHHTIHLLPRLKCVELYLHSSLRLPGLVLN